jgi:hypothetical protein
MRRHFRVVESKLKCQVDKRGGLLTDRDIGDELVEHRQGGLWHAVANALEHPEPIWLLFGHSLLPDVIDLYSGVDDLFCLQGEPDDWLGTLDHFGMEIVIAQEATEHSVIAQQRFHHFLIQTIFIKRLVPFIILELDAEHYV